MKLHDGDRVRFTHNGQHYIGTVTRTQIIRNSTAPHDRAFVVVGSGPLASVEACQDYFEKED